MILKTVKTALVATVFVASANFAHAQKAYTQGTITYGIEYALSPEMAPMASQLPNEQVVKFNGNFIKTEIQQGPATITIFQNFVDKVGLMLLDVPIAQMQYAIKMSKEDMEKNEASSPKFSYFEPTGEKGKIAGFDAEKYKYKDDKGANYELWATKDFSLPKGFSGQQFKDVEGALVKYTAFQNGIKMTLTLKKITDEKVGPFTLDIPSGYELKTLDDLKAMQGGGD